MSRPVTPPGWRARADVKQKARRAQRAAEGVCINGEKHGTATHGVLCERCRARHRESNKTVWVPGKGNVAISRLVRQFASTIVINPSRKTGGE